MAVTLTSIVTLVRYIIQDFSRSTSDIFTYATSSVFTLSEPNVIAVSAVGINDVTSGVSYTFDSSANAVTVSGASSGDTIELFYTYYSNFTDTELEGYVRASIAHISIARYKDFQILTGNVYPEPEEDEKNLIAMIASILVEPDNKTYKLPDMQIIVPNNSLPILDIIRKTIAVFKKNSSGIWEIL